MSKSDPDSAIFMEDTEQDLNRKVKKAFCPPEVVEGNPILDYVKHIIFGYFGKMTVDYQVGRATTSTPCQAMATPRLTCGGHGCPVCLSVCLLVASRAAPRSTRTTSPWRPTTGAARCTRAT